MSDFSDARLRHRPVRGDGSVVVAVSDEVELCTASQRVEDLRRGQQAGIGVSVDPESPSGGRSSIATEPYAAMKYQSVEPRKASDYQS